MGVKALFRDKAQSTLIKPLIRLALIPSTPCLASLRLDTTSRGRRNKKYDPIGGGLLASRRRASIQRRV